MNITPISLWFFCWWDIERVFMGSKNPWLNNWGDLGGKLLPYLVFWYGIIFNGNFRNLNWRYLPYIRPTVCKSYVRGYPHKIWPYMVRYLHFRILEFPLISTYVHQIKLFMSKIGHDMENDRNQQKIIFWCGLSTKDWPCLQHFLDIVARPSHGRFLRNVALNTNIPFIIPLHPNIIRVNMTLV